MEALSSILLFISIAILAFVIRRTDAIVDTARHVVELRKKLRVLEAEHEELRAENKRNQQARVNLGNIGTIVDLQTQTIGTRLRQMARIRGEADTTDVALMYDFVRRAGEPVTIQEVLQDAEHALNMAQTMSPPPRQPTAEEVAVLRDRNGESPFFHSDGTRIANADIEFVVDKILLPPVERRSALRRILDGDAFKDEENKP